MTELLEQSYAEEAVALTPASREDDAARTLFYSDVVAGLGGRTKSIPCKYFYDERGAELFEAIVRTPEYYPTRAEIEILTLNAPEIAALAGKAAHLVEFGSGSSHKVRLLLKAMPTLASYIAVDISEDYLHKSVARLGREFPDVKAVALAADFTQVFALPRVARDGRRIGFFPGSTIGNFAPLEAAAFLKRTAALLGPGGALIIGVDLKKDRHLLDAAYNDSAGVTAQFNLNLLRRINRELGANFDCDKFAHRAVYNAGQGRIEMYLDSTATQTVHVGDRSFSFGNGESIHTENSYKYTVPEFETLASSAGFTPGRVWTDRRKLFSVHYLVVS